jgi:S1-C subfamily serine protease
VGTGSGVIISEDGYIVTNNHVIKEPESEITLNNKKSYKAKLIGTDSKMDIALLKLTRNSLPHLGIPIL